MENFIFYNPTRLHFGRGVVNDLGETIKPYGRKILLIYGGGSIKRNGVYDDIMVQLNKIKAEVYEYSGIKPNPVYTDVDSAAKLGREKGVDLILAAGGGSVVDSAKALAVTIPVRHSCWDFYANNVIPKKAVPLINVLTLAATGSETNMFSVIQNDEVKLKTAMGSQLVFPKDAFLDPSYTISVPADQTANGISDLTAHCLENYFGKGDSPLTDKFIFSIIREAMECGPALLKDLKNHNLRARIMLSATMALNGLTAIGKERGDFGVHVISHVLSVLYDLPHGAALSIVYPAWLKFHAGVIPERISWLGKNLFGETDPVKTIAKLESFLSSLGSPVRAGEAGLTKAMMPEINRLMVKNKSGGNYYKFNKSDYPRLINLMF